MHVIARYRDTGRTGKGSVPCRMLVELTAKTFADKQSTTSRSSVSKPSPPDTRYSRIVASAVVASTFFCTGETDSRHRSSLVFLAWLLNSTNCYMFTTFFYKILASASHRQSLLLMSCQTCLRTQQIALADAS